MAHKATKHLKDFGYSIDDNDGGMVRMRHGRVYDKFVEVDGGYHYFLAENGAWSQRLHHIGEDGQPDYLWPDDFVLKVYKGAVERRAERAGGSVGA